jgi:hypothetical protein
MLMDYVPGYHFMMDYPCLIAAAFFHELFQITRKFQNYSGIQ